MHSGRNPILKATRLVALFLFLPALAPVSAVGQAPTSKPGKGPAYTVPPTDDPNYDLMGEFVGRIQDTQKPAEREVLALQIRPLSGNQFRAIAYEGGLPGRRSDREAKQIDLIGLRSGQTLVLSGWPWAVFVDREGCSLVDSQGKRLGRLKRVRRVSRTLGAPPPEGAVVLFDGSGTEQLLGGQITADGFLKEGTTILPMFQDFDLHVEFRLPYMPKADGQSRGNSGLYLQSRYECQVLDSFGTERLKNGLGALYKFKAPDVNMAFPPLAWQTYDIRFTAPRWAADGTKLRDAHVTSWVNGVKVQDNVALPSKTGAGKQEAPSLLPILIQDHGDPVRFRNIWIIDRGISHAKFPVIASEQQRKAAAVNSWEVEQSAPPSAAGASSGGEPKPNSAGSEQPTEQEAGDSDGPDSPAPKPAQADSDPSDPDAS